MGYMNYLKDVSTMVGGSIKFRKVSHCNEEFDIDCIGIDIDATEIVNLDCKEKDVIDELLEGYGF